MNSLGHPTKEYTRVIGPPSEESFLSPPDNSYKQFQPLDFPSQYPAEDGFWSLGVSALSADQNSGLVDWTFMQNEVVSQFATPRINYDEQQNPEQFISETWLTWALSRNASSFGMESTSPEGSLEGFGSESPCSHNFFQAHDNDFPIKTMAAHGPLLTDVANECIECSIAFSTKAALYLHSKVSNHSPHSCLCGKRFSRLDVLERHVKSLLSPRITYACPHCKKYRGSKAFRRRDHLTQHLRGYHHMELSSEAEDLPPPQKFQHSTLPARRKKEKMLQCAHERCLNSNISKGSTPTAFQSQSQLTQHMRDDHDQSLFPCQEAGCLRIGGKGFFRRKDLTKHMKEHY